MENMGKPNFVEERATADMVPGMVDQSFNGAACAFKESNGGLNGYSNKTNGWNQTSRGAKEVGLSAVPADRKLFEGRKMRSSGSCPQLQDFADQALEHVNGHMGYSDQSDSGLPYSRENLQRSSISTQESDEERREKGKGKKASWWKRRGKSKQKHKMDDGASSAKPEKDAVDGPITNSRWRWGRGYKPTDPPSSSPPSSSSASKASDHSDMVRPEAGLQSWSTLQDGISLGLSADQYGLKSVAEHAPSRHAAAAGCLASVFSRGSQSTNADLPERASRRRSWDMPKAGHARRLSDGSSHPLQDIRCSSSEVSRASSFEETFMNGSDAAPERSQSGSVLSRLASPFASWSHRPSKDPVPDGLPEARKGDADDNAAGDVNGQGEEQPQKKSHRRHNSLTSFLPSLPAMLARRASSVTLGEANRDRSPPRSNGHGGDSDSPVGTPGGPVLPPKTPEITRNVSALSCFGLGPKVTLDDDGGEQVEGSKASNGDSKALPPGTVGLRNLGNTCFINAAVQVICHAPQLAAVLVPEVEDLARAAVQKSPGAAGGSAAPNAAPLSKPSEQAPAANSEAAATIVAPGSATSLGEDKPSVTAAASDALSGAESSVDIGAAAAGQLSLVQDAPAVPQLPTITENAPILPEEGLPSGDQPETAAAEGETSDDKGASQEPGKEMAAERESDKSSSTATTAAAAEAPEQTAEQPETPMKAEAPIKTPSTCDNDTVQSIWGHNSEPASDAEHRAELPDAVSTEEKSLTATSDGASSAGASQGSCPAEVQEQADIAGSCTCQHLQPAGAAHLEATSEAAELNDGSPQSAAGTGQPDGDAHEKAAGEHPAMANAEADADSARAKPETGEPQGGRAENPQLAPPTYPPLKHGEMAETVQRLIREVYSSQPGSAFAPDYLIRKLYALPHGADFQDGGQHDCQEALRGLIQALHDDLKTVEKKPAEAAGAETPASEEPEEVCVEELMDETESAKADREWARYLAHEDSPITRLLAGQLQSSVTCHKCNTRFTMYEPFVDLSLPLIKEGKSGKGLSWFKSNNISILDCLHAFTAEELMQGDEAFQCEVCSERTSATKRLRLYRLPKVLLLHIKRFKYSSNAREKILTNVTFPLKGLQLHQFVSEDSGLDEATAGKYNLTAVSNHFGNMIGGHYTAYCKAPQGYGKDDQWFDYNDDKIHKVSASNVATAAAYILCYCRKD